MTPVAVLQLAVQVSAGLPISSSSWVVSEGVHEPVPAQIPISSEPQLAAAVVGPVPAWLVERLGLEQKAAERERREPSSGVARRRHAMTQEASLLAPVGVGEVFAEEEASLPYGSAQGVLAVRCWSRPQRPVWQLVPPWPRPTGTVSVAAPAGPVAGRRPLRVQEPRAHRPK